MSILNLEYPGKPRFSGLISGADAKVSPFVLYLEIRRKPGFRCNGTEIESMPKAS